MDLMDDLLRDQKMEHLDNKMGFHAEDALAMKQQQMARDLEAYQKMMADKAHDAAAWHKVNEYKNASKLKILLL